MSNKDVKSAEKLISELEDLAMLYAKAITHAPRIAPHSARMYSTYHWDPVEPSVMRTRFSDDLSYGGFDKNSIFKYAVQIAQIELKLGEYGISLDEEVSARYETIRTMILDPAESMSPFGSLREQVWIRTDSKMRKRAELQADMKRPFNSRSAE